ncbi:GLIPR1-like protein 1 [Chlorella vulgaris]
MAHLPLLLLFSLSTHLCVSALTTSKCVSATGPKGVLTVLNQIRAKFNAPPVKWNAALASASQQHANKCRWEHSLDAGENIYFTYGYQYPIDGLDACAYADKTWASQAASYNFKNPGVSRDGGQTHHFTQLVWKETSQVGCGVARCPNLANSGTDQPSDFVVCQYFDSGNWLDYDGSYNLYDDNVARTDCMVQTGDDWCDTCTSSTCNSCYQRAVNTGVPDGTPPIRLEKASGKCVSKCPPSVTNCASGCTAAGTCATDVPTQASLGAACTTPPTAANGVLTLTNALRKRHGSPPLKWNAAMASKAADRAGQCASFNSAKATSNNNNDLIFRTKGLAYPQGRLDACGFATQDWYNQATSYNFASPATSTDGGITSGFSQLVWKGTKQMGCGIATCSGVEIVVCQYDPPGNAGGATGRSTNVKRSTCQAATGDLWCGGCTAGSSPKCTACMSRSLYSGGGPKDRISLHAATTKCISKCPAGAANSANCAACTASGTCVQCQSGWKMNAAKRCLVLDCDQRYGSECDACSGSQCSKCSVGFQLNASRTGCIKAKRRKAAPVQRQPRKIRHLAWTSNLSGLIQQAKGGFTRVIAPARTEKAQTLTGHLKHASLSLPGLSIVITSHLDGKALTPPIARSSAPIGMAHLPLLLLFSLSTHLCVSALTTSKCVSPTGPKGVLTVLNQIRAKFNAPPVKWNAALASASQQHANKCRWEHSLDAGENIYFSYGYQYPIDGLDACAYADKTWASQAASYNFKNPGVSRDGGQTHHFTQLVWKETSQVGCGVARCPNLANSGTDQPSDFVVCQYFDSGNWLDYDGSYNLYDDNVARTDCMVQTGDDWCDTCTSSTCNSCYQRAVNTGVPDGTPPIRLEKASGKCVSKCPPSVTNCASGCTAAGTCATDVPTQASLGAACTTPPTAANGVLTLTNALRKRHGSPPLKWNAAMASKAADRAGQCASFNSAKATSNNNNDLIFRTKGLAYPQGRLDACGFATQDWYNQATSYNFASPATSTDGGITSGFSQLVWKGTKQMGCGIATCSGVEIVVCQYDPPGNAGGATGRSTNVKRSTCQAATGDLWCGGCTAGSSPKCTACMSRSLYSGGGPKDRISLHAATTKCISKCPAGAANSANCAACTASGTCVQCQSGWKMNAAKRCLVLDCDQRYGSECDACSGSQCSKCSVGFQLNASQTGCTKATRRKAALVRRQPRKIRRLA